VLVQRPDDNEVTVARRLEVYDAQTRPLIDHYRRQGLLHTLAAARPVDAVTADLVALLDTLGGTVELPSLGRKMEIAEPAAEPPAPASRPQPVARKPKPAVRRPAPKTVARTAAKKVAKRPARKVAKAPAKKPRQAKKPARAAARRPTKPPRRAPARRRARSRRRS
jgi:adenylate kinase